MRTQCLNFDPGRLLFTKVFGTGGLGSGRFFVLNGNHTLGREESRSGHFLTMRDYCKQHIVLYYLRALLGENVSVFPIGKIGDDETGKALINEMTDDGFEMKYVAVEPGTSTLFSFCFSYPDGSGGNLTTDNSASSKVDDILIDKAKNDIRQAGTKGMIIAAPEVPLTARNRLLETGKADGLFCAASFTSEEMQAAMGNGVFYNIDLTSVNLDEAGAIAGLLTSTNDHYSILNASIGKLLRFNPSMLIAVTAGKSGSWCWNGKILNHLGAIPVKTKNTAGAGDAFFSGLLTGIILGLDFFEAQQLATLIAGLSVTSPHTINRNIDRLTLKKLLKTSEIIFSESVRQLISD